MEKRQFIDQMITAVRDLPVSSVLSLRMHFVERGSLANRKGLCPFHSDKTVGSFVATDSKGIWKCFSCGIGGDAIKFIALTDKISYLEASFLVALQFRIISQTEYEEYFEKRRYSKEFHSRVEKKYENFDKEKMRNDIASEEDRHKVFSIFMSFCELSEQHRKHLEDERCLTPKEIESGKFFTFPTRKILKKFSEAIRTEYGNENILATIPGFYREVEKNYFTFVKHKGIGIGIQNSNGQIVGIQIRNDYAQEDRSRYIWFSSAFASLDDKFEDGTSAGSPMDVVYPEILKSKSVFITEGRFKALKIAKETGSIAISVQGVTSWRGIWKVIQLLKQVVKEKYNIKFELSCIYIAYDADMSYRHQVFQQAKKMSDMLVSNECITYYLNWDLKLGKGIDDMYINGHQNAINKYDKELWDENYDSMLMDILENSGYKELKDVPISVSKEYFDKYFSNFNCLPKNKHSKLHDDKINEKKIASMV